jgi:galactonate dehydratase
MSTDPRFRIAAVETQAFHHWVFATLRTEDEAGSGQVGWWAFPDATVPIIDALRPVLIGQDVRDTGRLWVEMYRAAPFRGGALMSAIAALDQAAWDLKGRLLGLPAYQLAGGRQRDRAELMVLLGMRDWPRSATTSSLVEEARYWVGEGFAAVKLDPLLEGEGEAFHEQSHARRIEAAYEVAAAVREEVGWNVDIALELHRKLGPAETVVLAEVLQPLRLLAIEDPLPPDSISALAELGPKLGSVPLAAGERQDSIYRFAELLDADAAEFIRPDVGTAGGLTNCLKIAAMAEARHRRIVCHNFHSPFLTAATLQLYAAIPNVGYLEWSPLDELEPRSLLLEQPLEREGGALLISEAPGLGVRIHSDAAERLGPFQRLPVQRGWRQDDGSIHYR